ncbi:hypothetical protein DAPPUDRAFT_120058 [Daphnia pulex]|uniref:MYND-type domain-containing protein n=1 Tax=Daphnia pulex TaxID=6669 RepID=E9I068_DAPPU|nr:hypothetical protein DAPPUDRAFT_120058 [Daphnia pulex]|eukprot:EFX62616.1 hypothetical protein DAPPUDRAFT_120058 [Daphnia pulex]
MISPTRCQATENFLVFHPYGNLRVRNVLKDFRDQSFFAQDFDPNKEEDFSFLWDVWYNTDWPETTRKRFLVVLNDLLDEKLPENVTVPDPNHYKCLKKIWKVWYTISSRNQSESEMLLCKSKLQRSELFVTSHETTIFPPHNSDEKITHAKAYSRAVNEITQYLMKRNAIGDLEDSVGRIIEQEFQAFYERGSCRLQNELETVCVNSSFLNPDTEQWEVHYSSCPFLGYLPLSQDQELITSVKDKILLPTCQKIMKDTVDSYRSRIADIEVFFHLEDALEFCFTNANKFDVIDCSSADRFGLANILNAASGRLSNNPGAVLFTRSTEWDNFAPTVELYVEHMAEILMDREQLNEETFTKEFKAIECVTRETGKIISVEPYELLLWNLILRLNSTKIVPSSEQTRHLASGMNGSWLFATFVSPLYVDAPVNPQDVRSQFSTNDSTSADEKCCGACKKVPQIPKRCSRCRSIVYCSVECQRSNWPQHKLLCKRK